ncbi:deaminase [Rhodococcus sp. 05-2254-4]|nr:MULTISPECIES: dihydrofolate reductase family protein [unclassified Rhodococcus (in: high G+C Gram-positive bacteria)]OZE37629.1 deaminase [Rhodococcus sp. 05-2254-4]OZE40761.1 deaminase [Rhodococcus sp. 05-2254-3]OZE45752.1 deaminase [Rhodococcus sp. 05-2254-2]
MMVGYTADIFSTLDGFASPRPGTWGGYWGKESDAWLTHRRTQFAEPQRMVLGANTYRLFLDFRRSLGSDPEIDKAGDVWVDRMMAMPTSVISSTLQTDRTSTVIATGSATDVVSRLKTESTLPLRSRGSISLNRALMAAGLVDRLQLTIFPVITGTNGTHPIYRDGPDFDLDMIDSRTFDGGIQELVYRPVPHT